MTFSGVVAAIVFTVARFPGGGPLPSASGRLVVENVELEGKSAARAHALFVTDRATRERKLLLQYARSVAVAWAPDRDALAVMNRVGNTQSTLVIYTMEKGVNYRKTDVAEVLYAAFPNLRGELTSYLHVHLELVQWRRDGGLECRLRASGGSGPDVLRRYLVTRDGKAERL